MQMRALVKIGILTTIAVLAIVSPVTAQNDTSSDEVLTRAARNNG